MSDFFGTTGSEDDFILPGDAEKTAEILAAADETPAAEPAAEPEAEPAVEPEAAAEAETAAEPEAEKVEPELILGKFKTPEDLARSTEELERHYEDLQREVGSLRNELGEARRAAEAVQQPARAPMTITQDLIDTNPAAATQLAFEQGNEALLAAAFEEWEAQSPARAAAWVSQKQIEENNKQWSARYDALAQQYAPLTEQASKNELTAGVQGLREKYPDIGEFIGGDEFAAIADKIPLAKKALTEGAPEEVVSAIETVYLIHRGRATDNLAEIQRDNARTAAVEAEKVREEAYVASATATAGAARLSRAEEIAKEWSAETDLIKAGWNVN